MNLQYKDLKIPVCSYDSIDITFITVFVSVTNFESYYKMVTFTNQLMHSIITVVDVKIYVI